MGGVGKTQIAIEYAYRQKEYYAGIYWIGANDQDAIFSGLHEIGIMAGCITASTETNSAEMSKTVLSWLQEQKSWLLVIDGLNGISVADGYLPETKGRCHTLITTRDPDARKIPAEGC
jgi:hypothetical protein